MATVGLVYYSMYGSTHALATEIAEGVKQAGSDPQLRVVDELLPQEVIEQQGLEAVKEQMEDVPPAAVEELAEFDGVLFGTGTRYGSATSQLQNFFDQTGPLWQQGALIGKPAGFFTGASTIHGGFESTVLSMSTFAFHHGMVIVGAGYGFSEVNSTRTGGSPYGPSHLSPVDGSKQGLSDDEIAIARQYGEHFARIADKLAA